MAFYKLIANVRTSSTISKHNYQHVCVLAAKCPYDAVSKFIQLLESSESPIQLDENKYIHDVFVEGIYDLNSLVVSTKDGKLIVERVQLINFSDLANYGRSFL